MSKVIDHLGDARGRRELWLTIGAALLIAFITRPVTQLGPQVWTEASWQSALHQAAYEGLPFGDHGILFTYGPLGFLELPTYWYGTSGAFAVIISFIEPALVAGLLIAVLRVRFGWWMALGCAFIALLMRDTIIYHPALPLAAVIAALYVVARPTPANVRALAVIGGLFAGYATLGRINAGITIAAVVGIALLFCDDRRRNVPLAIGAGVLAFALGWLASGQALGDVPGYLSGTLDVLGGHAEAMPFTGGPRWQYPAAALIIVAGFVAAWFTGRQTDGRDCRAALACIWLAFSYLGFKQGFVRQDFHTLYFIQGATVALLAMPWLASQRTIVLSGLAVLTLVYAVSAHDTGLQDLANVPSRTASSAKASWLIADSGRRNREIDDGLAKILRQRALPPQIQARMRRGTWTVWPNELSLVRAARGRLRPLPTLQSYITYTGSLDARNADALRDDERAPQYILYLSDTEFDRRLPVLDAPETTRVMACRYKPDGGSLGPYTVLKRVPDRCTAPPRKLTVTRTKWDGRVVVPQPSSPDSFVYARIEGAGISGLERIRTELFRAYMRELRYYLDFTDPPAARHRLIPGSAADGVIVASGAKTDIPRLPGFAQLFPVISAWREDSPSKPLTYTFYEQRVNPVKLARSRDFWLTLLAAAVISVIARPVFSLTPGFGVEASWRAALSMAAEQHLHFGPDVVFAYGPAGWLLLPAYWFENTGALAVAYSFAEPFVFAALLVAVLRHRFGWVAALLLTFAVLSMTLDPVYQPRLPLIALIAAVVVVARPERLKDSWEFADRSLLLAVAGGVLSGFALLGRVNAGAMAALIVLAALLFVDDRRRNIPLFAAATIGSVVLGWLVFGQSLGDLPGYAVHMVQIGSGYAEAMQIEASGVAWEYLLAFVLTGASWAAIWFTAPDKRALWGLSAVWLVTLYFAFKQGFVRHDAHSLFFFQTMILFALVLPWKPSQRVPAYAAATVAIVLFVVAVNRPVGDIVGPAGRTKAAFKALHTLVDGNLRTQHRRDGQKFVLAQLSVPPDYVNQLRTHTATAWPWEQSIVWAAGGKLDPITTLQTYQAYTSSLEKLNADLLSDEARAPQRLVFLRYDQFDGRATAFEAPRALRALFCNYELESRSFQLQMWVHTGNRCKTPPRPAGMVKAAWGQTVQVPAPSTRNSFVYVEVDGVQVKGLEKLGALLFKSRIRVVELDGNRRKRLIPAVAADGAVVRAGSGIELARPFQLSAGATELTFLKRGSSPSDGKPLTLRFYEQSVAPAR